MSKTSTRHLIHALLIAGTSVLGLQASATPAPAYRADRSAALFNASRERAAKAFESKRSNDIRSLNERIFGSAGIRNEKATPAFTTPGANIVGTLNAPEGKTWFYTGAFRYDSIPPHDDVYFTDLILREYTMTIYDENFNVVGKIKDDVDYHEDEVRVPLCDVAPCVSRHFWNTDDNLEFMVGIAFNAGIGVVNYRTYVYSILPGASEPASEPVAVMDQLVTDMLDASDNNEENLFLTFTSEYYGDWDFPEDFDWLTGSEAFWEYLLSNKMTVEIYGKADASSDGPRLLLSKDIPILQLPGDQMNISPLMAYIHYGKPVFLFTQYREPFYNPYYTPADENVTMRDGNSLVADFYTIRDGALRMSDRITIPALRDDIPEVLASYYSIGSMRWTDDVNYTDYNTGGNRPALIVTKENYMVGADDSYTNSYYVYGPDGKRLGTLFENAMSALSLSDIEGCERQQMFVDMSTGVYNYHFVDMVSMQEVLNLEYDYQTGSDGDYEMLTANVDRTPLGDSYQYAFEMRLPSMDDMGNDNARVARINADGSFDKIDEINMGTDVMYAKIYIEGSVLDPDFYCKDDAPEYMILIKRGTPGEGTTEDLIVGQARTADSPAGYTFLQEGADEHGPLSAILPVISPEGNRLLVGHYNDTTGQQYADFFNLPFIKSGVGNICTDTDSVLFIAGNLLKGNGLIEVFALDGIKVAEGISSLNISSLPNGVYAARFGKKTLKLIVNE